MPAVGFGGMARVGNLWCYCIPFQQSRDQVVNLLGYPVFTQGFAACLFGQRTNLTEPACPLEAHTPRGLHRPWQPRQSECRFQFASGRDSRAIEILRLSVPVLGQS